jgi:hypothetical protein
MSIQDWDALKFASEALQDDREVALAAVRISGQALLQKNKKLLEVPSLQVI